MLRFLQKAFRFVCPNIGTRSLLIGAHTFWLHPFCVARAWYELYGFPKDIRIWMAFILHDVGYFGKKDMDGEDGKTHPVGGAKILSFLFDKNGDDYWYRFSAYHSRSYAKACGMETSKLCSADKLAFCYQIKWIYLIGCMLTGEIDEYLENAKNAKLQVGKLDASSYSGWYDSMDAYMQRVGTWTSINFLSF